MQEKNSEECCPRIPPVATLLPATKVDQSWKPLKLYIIKHLTTAWQTTTQQSFKTPNLRLELQTARPVRVKQCFPPSFHHVTYLVGENFNQHVDVVHH